MRAWVVAVVTAVAMMGAGFGLGNLHPFGDPRVEPAEGLGRLLRGAKMPAEAKAVLCVSARTATRMRRGGRCMRGSLRGRG
jgi:hypothetical protein